MPAWGLPFTPLLKNSPPDRHSRHCRNEGKAMTEPKVVHEFRDYAYNSTMPFERRSMLIGVCDRIDRLAARVRELERMGTSESARLSKLVTKYQAENTRLREAAATSIRKCKQYWNEHNIPDAEMHAALELIHSVLYVALKEKP